MGLKARVILVTGIIALSIALYLMPSKAPDKKPEGGMESVPADQNRTAFSVESFIENTKKQYRPAQLAAINRLEAALKESGQLPVTGFDSLARAWDELKQPGIAAIWYEKKAEADQSERSYIEAAYRYFDAYKTASDSAGKTAWVQKAIHAYQRVIDINPKNLDARTDLGVCYAEGTAEPMKGIMLLREVVKENPDHENAQLNLGFLSVRSTQYDKAMERFNKVLEINPKRVEVLIYLGETSLNMGDKEKALGYFEKYLKVSPDEEMKKQVENYIMEIKK